VQQLVDVLELAENLMQWTGLGLNLDTDKGACGANLTQVSTSTRVAPRYFTRERIVLVLKPRFAYLIKLFFHSIKWLVMDLSAGFNSRVIVTCPPVGYLGDLIMEKLCCVASMKASAECRCRLKVGLPLA
jgi:hypothetical protein